MQKFKIASSNLHDNDYIGSSKKKIRNLGHLGHSLQMHQMPFCSYSHLSVQSQIMSRLG